MASVVGQNEHAHPPWPVQKWAQQRCTQKLPQLAHASPGPAGGGSRPGSSAPAARCRPGGWRCAAAARPEPPGTGLQEWKGSGGKVGGEREATQSVMRHLPAERQRSMHSAACTTQLPAEQSQHAQRSFQQSNRSMHSAACTAQRLHTHPPPHSPAPDLEPSACHTLTLWLRCLRRAHGRCCCRHLHQHCRPRLHRCYHCRCCRQWPPGGRTTNPGDPLPGCPPQAPLPQQPCPRGAAQQRTGSGLEGSPHWWPALRGSAALRPPSRHEMRPSAGRMVADLQATGPSRAGRTTKGSWLRTAGAASKASCQQGAANLAAGMLGLRIVEACLQLLCLLEQLACKKNPPVPVHSSRGHARRSSKSTCTARHRPPCPACPARQPNRR